MITRVTQFLQSARRGGLSVGCWTLPKSGFGAFVCTDSGRQSRTMRHLIRLNSTALLGSLQRFEMWSSRSDWCGLPGATPNSNFVFRPWQRHRCRSTLITFYLCVYQSFVSSADFLWTVLAVALLNKEPFGRCCFYLVCVSVHLCRHLL